MPRPKAPTKANGALWNKDISAQQETVDTTSSSAPATPPTRATPINQGTTQEKPTKLQTQSSYFKIITRELQGR